MNEIIDIINNWGGDRESDLIKNYTTSGIKASGNWGKQLERKTEITQNGYRLTFLGTKYTQQLVSGRRPNSNQNKDSIKAFVGWAGSTFLNDWVKSKGLKISPFAVAYKLARKGITVPNKFNDGTIISSVFTDEAIKELIKSISVAHISEMRTDIKTIFK